MWGINTALKILIFLSPSQLTFHQLCMKTHYHTAVLPVTIWGKGCWLCVNNFIYTSTLVPDSFFFHKKITHPLISKIIRHNDKTCTLIFKVLKVQKLMIYLVVILKERKRRQLMLML